MSVRPVDPHWLFAHALRIAAILAVGFALAWVVAQAFGALSVLSVLREWLPVSGIVDVIRLTTLLTALLYVVVQGTARD